MKTTYRRTCAFLASALWLTVSVLGGCMPRSENPKATTAAPFSDEPFVKQESPEEKALAARKEFDRFTEELFLEEVSSNQLDFHFSIKDPAAFGLSSAEELYGPISKEVMVQNISELQDLDQQIKSFDAKLLTDAQKLTLRILQSHVETQLMSEGLELYSQPLAPTTGIQAQLPVLLSEYEFRNRQDVDDYLKMIGGLDEYYGEILKLEQAQSEAGLMMNDSAIDHIIESCESYLLVPGENFMIDTFRDRLNALPDLTEEDRTAYLQQHAALLESDFVPAYQLLIDGMTALKGTGIYEGGLCNYPDGKEYYRYLVYDSTGTSYETMEDMLDAMELLITENLQKTTALTQENPQLLEDFESCQFRQTEPEAMLEELKTLTAKDFPPLPECNYTLKYVPAALELSLSPAFYVTPPVDDYKNNVIYVNGNSRFENESLYATIAHEGVPGHLYQNVYFRASDACNLRRILPLTGYAEGWATYVEQYSYTLDNGLSPELGQLFAANQIATLGLQACLDVYINYYGWTMDQVTEYLGHYFSEPEEIAQNIYDAMIENPANYVAYYVGYLEFHNMRKIAEQQLGENFDLKEFHTFLLDLGPAPFDVVQPYFTSWLMGQRM